MKSKKAKIITAVCLIVLAVLFVPYSHIKGTKTVYVSKGNMIVGEREHCCEHGGEFKALCAKYGNYCADGETATVEVTEDYNNIKGTDRFSEIKKGTQVKFVKPNGYYDEDNSSSGVAKLSELKEGDKVYFIAADINKDYTVEDEYVMLDTDK